MHFKKDVLSQFREVRSYERIDLLCSLLDLCLPFELRFLGTCLEFLGKRDFSELREDERQANNVNFVSQLRSLTDENTRRKLVLYVSLLKSCNSDCANCFNETLAALNINEVCLSYRAEPDLAAKVLDELLLLYTIALNHPAFTIHQKSEFATILAHLQEEDRKLSMTVCSSKDSKGRCPEYCLLSDSPEDSALPFKSSPLCSIEGLDGSSQLSVKSLASPLTCHVPSGQAFATDVLSPTLSQSSTASFGPPPVMVSSVCGHTTTSPFIQVPAKTSPDMLSVMGSDTSQSPVPMALPGGHPVPPPVAPTTSSIVIGHNMMLPLGVPPGPSPTSSHSAMPSPSLSSGKMGMSMGPQLPQMLGIPHESMIHMPFPGPHSPWKMMLPMPGHIPASGTLPVTAPTTPCTPGPAPAHASVLTTIPTSTASSTIPSGQAFTTTTESGPSSVTTSLSTPASISTGTTTTSSCSLVATPTTSVAPTTIPSVSSCISSDCMQSSHPVLVLAEPTADAPSARAETSAIHSVTATDGVLTLSQHSSPASSRAPSPPRKSQGHKKNHHYQNHQPGSHTQLQNMTTGPPVNHQSPHNQTHLHEQPQHVQGSPNQTSQSNQSPMNQPHQSSLQQQQHSPQHQSPSPPQQPQTQNWQQNCVDGNWHSPANSLGDTPPVGDHIKEAIGREMPKYQASLQDFSPDELWHMGDEQLKDLGLPLSAIQQLRSIVRKVQTPNGFSCISRHDPSVPSEGRRFQGMEGQMIVPMAPMLTTPSHCLPSYAYVPMAHTGNGNACNTNGGCGVIVRGSSNRHNHYLTHQMRTMRLDDDSRRPCSNSSSTSDCSSGSHSPPETPSLPSTTTLPPNHHWDRGTWPSSIMHSRRVYDHHVRRGSDHHHNMTQSAHSLHGYSGKDSSCESWNSIACDDRNREDRLYEPDRCSDDRTRGPNYQPPGMLRNSMNRPRGLNKATPPGIPTIPRGRGHHIMDKSRRDVNCVSMNGVPPPPPADVTSPPAAFPMSAGATVPYNTPVTSFLPPSAFPAMHTFHRFQPANYIHPASTAYPFHPNGDLWSQYQPPVQNHQFIAPIVAFSPAHPPPKLSCYNCGGQGHHGAECKESTFEEITQQGQYHLDYKPYKETGDCRESDK